MNLRHLLCKGLVVLKMHDPGCTYCSALQSCWGLDMRKRLEELGKREADRKPWPVPQPEEQNLQSTRPTNITIQNPEMPEEPHRKIG
jgi:hypothetical protein